MIEFYIPRVAHLYVGAILLSYIDVSIQTVSKAGVYDSDQQVLFPDAINLCSAMFEMLPSVALLHEQAENSPSTRFVGRLHEYPSLLLSSSGI